MDKSLKISKHDVTPYTFHLHSQFAQLLSLIRRGHYDDCIDLLRREPKILKLRDRMGRSALHHCADCWPMSPNRPNVNADIGQILIRMMPNIVEWQDQEGNIALHLAVINGDLPFVRKLLRSMTSAQINIADYELHTVIHWAVVSGQLDAMTMAIEHGADPSTPDIYGAYPLHYATQNFFDMATTGNSVQSSIKIGSTRHLSSQQLQQMQLFGSSTNNLHQLEPIPLLLPDINSKSSSISHLQHQKQQPQQSTAQARAESLRILHYLLTRPQIDVNCIDNEQRTPLIWAASSGNHDALLVLVKSGAEISQQDKDGLSALHCASSRGHYRCVHTLITMCGADVHQLDSGGCTPLFYAVALGHPDCVRLLMESGARLDHQDNKGRTAAHCGASKGQFETLKLLHENGANLWLKNVRGDLPLHDAVKSGRVDLVKWFLDQSPESVNDANHYGRTPLHIAAFNHNLEMCKLLISYGANVNAIMKIRNQYLTPLEAALQNGNDIRSVNLDELLEYLRRNGAQSLSQIDRHLVDHNIDKLNETDIDTNAKFLLSPLSDKNMPTSINDPLPQKDSSIALDPSLSKIRSRRSHETNRAEDQRRTGTKTKSARFADSETTKLPNLVQNGHDNKSRNIPNSDSSSSTSTSTSSPPNSIIHSASSHHHKHHFSEHLKNVREYETILDDDKNKDNCHLKHHPTHLKQAIITNVYLTTAAPIATTNGAIPLTPIENKDGEITSTASIATGTALVPVYYVKRVPQLKKISTSQKRTKKLKKTRIIGDGQVSVKLETRDTFQSTSGDLQQKQQHHEEHLFIQNEIISDKSAIDSRENDGENKDEDAGDEDENEDAEEEEGEDKLNQEDEENSEIMMTVLATKEHEEEVNEENEEETIEDKTPDSGAANQITESQEVIEDKKDDGDDVMTRESLSASSFESTAMDTVRKDSKIISDDDNSKDTRPEIPHELIQRDFVQSINHDDDHDHENIDEDKDDDGRRKRSIANIINEPKLTAQKSVESLRSPKLSAANFVEEAEEEASTSMKDDAKEDANQDLADEQRPLLIIKMTQKVEKDEDSEPRIVDVTNEQDANNAKTIDDNVSKNESTDHQTETDDHSEVHEMEIRKKEIIYNVIDDNVASKTDEIATQSADTMTINEDENENEKKSMESIVEQKSLEIREDPNKMAIESSSAPSLHSSDVDDNLDDQSQQQQGEESHLKPSDDDQSSVIRRGSFTKGSIGEMSVVDRRTIKQSISSDKIVDNTDVVSDNKQDYPAPSPVIESSFGPVKQLKGKKKSYDYVRPKVDTYWSDDYYQHHQQQHHMNRRDHSPGQLMVASKYHDRCKHPYHHHHYCHHDKYGSMGYLATSSHDDYARIDPKIINQTVEKYLRKYYLERQLFEELYDLKRYQIRTGRTNEPQSVRRLVDRFRREMKAPGMVDFKGPYTYRAYEMYLYDLLRQLSRSNHKKIAYLTKSISYDDLASSFERLQAELNESAAAAQTCDHVHHHRPKRQHGEYYAKIAGVNASDISSETSDFPNDQHRREYNEKRKRESATTRHRSHSRYDPLQDYDRHPHGLVVDYKYEYHKSQHRRGDDKRGELVDVICENLFKSTGLHGSKMDEMAVTRKIVQLSGQEDNGNNNNNDDVDINNASDKPEKSSMNDMKGDDGNSDHVATTEQKVRWPKHCDCKNNSYNKRECNYTNNNYMNDYDDDDDGYNLSRCSIYGHQGLSPLNIIESNSNSPVNLNRRLQRLANNNSSNSNKTISNVKNRKPKRKIYFLSNEPYKVNIPCENAIHQRWQQIKQQERKRKLNSNFRFNNRRSSYTSSSIDSDVTLWFELNQKWRS